ncbi:MAG: ABC transporter permease, partial [Nanoarchaeota archaeon]|nr:ABC transporter permease [Nanoarchaeota archaeon]
TSLQNDLSAAKTKLSAAATAIDGSASGLSSATTTLQEANAALDTVQSALSALQSNLESQQVTEPGTVASPIVTKIEKVAKDSTFLNYTFPTLLVLVIMFSSLLLGTILVMMEKNSPAFLRNYFLPIKKTTFIISIYLTNLVLILVQIIILLGISLLFLQESLPALPSIALILFISASVFIFLGMAIGYLFASEETAVLASISAGSILLFVSGVVLPLEAISPSLRDISAFNPFVLSEKIIREIFIFGSSLAQVWQDLIILIGYAIILFLIILIIESFLHRQLVHKFLKRHHEVHRQQDQVNKNDV